MNQNHFKRVFDELGRKGPILVVGRLIGVSQLRMYVIQGSWLDAVLYLHSLHCVACDLFIAACDLFIAACDLLIVACDLLIVACDLLLFTERETLLSWDRRIQGVCYQVNSIVDKINSVHPEWANSALESQMSH